MSVYVDPIGKWAVDTSPRCFVEGSCHLYADSVQELHEFAAKIGMKRSWFQNHRSLPHYDLTVGKRLLAVKLGAVEHTRAEAVEKWKELRK